MNILALQNDTRELCSKNGWTSTSADVRFMRAVGELGEVAEEVLRIADGLLNDVAVKRLAHEVYDTAWNLCSLASIVGVSLEPLQELNATSDLQERLNHATKAFGHLAVALARHIKAGGSDASREIVSERLNETFKAVCEVPGLTVEKLEELFREKAAYNMTRTWAH